MEQGQVGITPDAPKKPWTKGELPAGWQPTPNANQFYSGPLTDSEITASGEVEDWSLTLTALDVAVRDLKESLPNGDKNRTLLSHASSVRAINELGRFLEARGVLPKTAA